MSEELKNSSSSSSSSSSRKPGPWRSWQWSEICAMWEHPDLTAAELHELYIPRHTVASIHWARSKWGRYNASRVPTCSKCGERPVWVESAKARRYGLCKGCYLDEERMRLEDERKSAALRQYRHRAKLREERNERKKVPESTFNQDVRGKGTVSD